MFSVDRIEALYLSFPPTLRRRIPERVKVSLRAWLLPEWRRSRSSKSGSLARVRAIENRLWGGFSRSALAELEAIKQSQGPRRTLAQAGWTLARWHSTRSDYAAAYDNIVFASEAHPAGAREKRQFLPEAKFLCLLGRPEEARTLLDTRAAEGLDPSIALMRASAYALEGDERAALAEINAVFRSFGLVPIGKRDPGRPLSIDNLAAAEAPPRPDARRSVTVIVPAFECADTLPTALEGLAAQSWENLEVLIVDDCSTDATAEVAAAFCDRDPRFRLLRQNRNGGSYACRNRALCEATGDFVTVHDADDWSHPEKIRIQAEDLARGEPHNFTAWARTLPHLMFLGTAQATRTLISLNFSSHMLRRDALLASGGWDHIRVTGDSELIWRIEALAGRRKDAFRDRLLMPACPLSFGRLSPSSLTGTEGTHVLSIHHGVRREYREAADHWHARLRTGSGREALGEIGVPRFPAPPQLRPERPAAPPLDLLVIGDFNMLGGTYHSATAMLRAGLDPRFGGRLACGVLHYRRYDLDPTRPLNPDLRDFAGANGIRIIAPGESLRAATVLFTHPPLASHVMDHFPEIDHDHLVVVVNQMAERDLQRTSIAYDPALVRANLTELFGSEGIWAPISERVRRLMAEDPRYPAPHDDIWTPLIDLDRWTAEPPRWRGAERSRPVLGRHGRDHPLKWPSDPGALQAAYCAGKPCEVRFLGGAAHARKKLGAWPRNWIEEPFGVRDIWNFLSGLDVFLHFPDRDYIEEFGRAPMEAMAKGIPVILPPEFEPTFGPAALYCEPEEVWQHVEALWRDEAAWGAQAAAGRTFVTTTCGYDAFPHRLARIARIPPQAKTRTSKQEEAEPLKA